MNGAAQWAIQSGAASITTAASASIYNGTTPATTVFRVETNAIGGAVVQTRADVTRLCIVCFGDQ